LGWKERSEHWDGKKEANLDASLRGGGGLGVMGTTGRSHQQPGGWSFDFILRILKIIIISFIIFNNTLK
jgi:hypothetical protein